MDAVHSGIAFPAVRSAARLLPWLTPPLLVFVLLVPGMLASLFGGIAAKQAADASASVVVAVACSPDPACALEKVKALYLGYAYAAAWAVLAAAAVAAFLAGIAISRRNLERQARLPVALTSAVIALVVVWMVVGGESLYANIGGGAFGKTIGSVDGQSWLPLLDRGLDISNFLAGLASVSIAVACCTAAVGLPRARNASGGDSEALGNIFAARIEGLRAALAFGAVLLAAGVAASAAWHAWPTPLVQETDRAKLTAVSDAILALQSTSYVLVLLSLTVGPGAILMFQARQVAEALFDGSRQQVREWLEKHGLTITFPSLLKSASVAASPLALAELLKTWEDVLPVLTR